MAAGAAGRLLGQDLAAVERAVGDAESLGARTGVAVCDEQGAVLYRHRATEAFAPASNMKVLTAAAVLQGLGADFAFTTTFALRGGRLVVTASGDPNWITGGEHDPARVFAAVAIALRRAGVTSVADVVLDRGTFTGPDRPLTWPQDQLYTYYCAPTGPFVLEQGTLAVTLSPGDGRFAEARLSAPLADVPLRGSIDVVDRAKGAVYGAADHGDCVQVRGSIYRKSPTVTIRSAVADPAVWYLAALRTALQHGGVAVGGGAPGVGDTVVYEHRSDLKLAVRRMLEDSSNFDAEQCLRVLGHVVVGDGSLQGGLTALRRGLEATFGTIPANVALLDGSGLSRDNRLTPGLLLNALFATRSSRGGTALRDCLPVAGQSGTLEERFVGSPLVGRVRAKTGWIRGASALSGLVERTDGGVRYFSILMNYDPKLNGRNKDLKAAQERIVAAIEALPRGR